MSSIYPKSNDRDWNLLFAIANNTAGIADLEAGDVASITGTPHQITASQSTGAVTLSLPASVYGITSLGVNTGSTAPLTELQVSSTSTSSPRGIMSSQYTTDTMGARLGFTKARGTQAAPTTIVTGDNIGRLNAWPYDGTNYLEMASIIFGTEGTIATNRTPTNISFWTATNAQPSVNTQRLIIDSSGNFTASTGAWWLNNATGGMPGAGVINARGFQIDGVAVATSTDTYWNINTGTLWYTGGGVNLTGNGTLAAGALGANSVTAAAATNLTLSGGSSGASLVLGQGTNGGFALTPVGTGTVTVTFSGSHTNPTFNSGGAVGVGFDIKRTTATAAAGSPLAQFNAYNGSTRSAIIEADSDGATDSGRLDFYVKATGGSLTQAMVLKSTGNLLIGGATDISGSGGLKVFGTTASTSTTTGSLVNAGGLGNAGKIYAGSDITTIGTVAGVLGNYVSNASASGFSSFSVVNTGASGYQYSLGTGGSSASLTETRQAFYIYDNTNNQTRFTIDSSGNAKVYVTTASSSTTTGALVVGGGVGVAGAAWIGGAINLTGALNYTGAASIVSSGDTTFSTTSGSGNILLTPGTTSGIGKLVTTTNAQNAIFLIDCRSAAVGGVPALQLNKNNNTADNRLWDFVVTSAGTFSGRAVNDAQNAANSWVDITRSGTTISSVSIPATTDSTSSSTGALVVTGGAGIGKNLSTGGGRIKHTKIVTATYTQDTTTVDEVLVGNHATVAFTITLLAAGAAGMTGRSLVIKNRGAATVTVAAAAAASEIFSTSAVSSVALAVGQSVTLVSDGVYWNVC